MCSISFMDLFVDTMYSVSTKMKELSFKRNSSSLCLLADSPGLFQLSDSDVCNGFFGEDIFSAGFDYVDDVKSSKLDLSFVRSLGNNYRSSNNCSFSPHLFNVVNDSIRYLKQSSTTLPVTPAMNISHMLCELSVVKPPVVGEKFFQVQASESAPLIKMTEQPNIKMSVLVQCAPGIEKTSSELGKSNVPNGVALNVQLANRKTKELHKRSKKRRRRQKKGLHVNPLPCPKSSQQSHSQSFDKDPRFVVTVKQQSPQSFTSQFVISVAGLSDDDSDWESCPDLQMQNSEYELAGLFVANFSCPSSLSCPSRSFDVEITSYTREEAEELSKLETLLREVNKDWDEKTKDVEMRPKQPSKVSFASDEQLVEVLPADICDRKGEWELYAIERMRFKRRIAELEKIISPCLTVKHRSKIYNELNLDNL